MMISSTHLEERPARSPSSIPKPNEIEVEINPTKRAV